MVTPDRSPPTGEEGPFRRQGARRAWHWQSSAPPDDEAPIGDLSEFEQSEPEDDYRHRMTVNALGLLVTILLVVAGIWLADKIAETQATQDCLLSGRRNCAAVDVPRTQHF
jgi:hypothetical protein